ncbi:MAG: hypothetical protein K2G31_04655 [Clostridia bacterium]|nr:hypothetical protein [Clostridia bacterium]
MSYFVVLIFMLMLGIDLSYVFKRGFGQTAAAANFMLIFALYIGGLLADMRTMMYMFLAGVILLTIYVGIRVARRNELMEIKKVFKNPILYFYAIVGVMVGIIFIGFASSEFDEMTHWAISVKNMFEYDNFGNIGNTTTMFNQYVPASGIFGYAFQIFGSKFSNGLLFASMDLLITSLLLPVAELFSKKSSLWAIATYIVAVFVPVLFKYNIFAALQVDALMGVMFAYIYLSYIVDRGKVDGFTIINISLAAFVLTLIKSAGIAHVIFALILVVVDVLTRRKKEMKEFFSNRLNIVAVLLPVILMAFAKLSWSWYVDFYDVRAGWSISDMTVTNILGWLKSPNAFQQEVTKNFFRMFFLAPFAYVNNTCLQQSQLFFMVCVIATCIGLYFATKNKPFVIAQSIASIVIIVGYGLSLLLMYLFSFSYAEGLGLSEYSRYSGTVYIGISLTVFYQLVEAICVPMSDKSKSTVREGASAKRYKLNSALITATLSVALFVTFSAVGNVTCVKKAKKIYEPFENWLSVVETLDKDNSVYIVIDDSVDGWLFLRNYLSMRFFATPMQTSGYLEGGSYVNGRESNTSWTGNPFSMELSVEELASEMSNYTHVYLYDVWDEFEEKFGELFIDEIEDDGLYEIIQVDGQTRLVRA